MIHLLAVARAVARRAGYTGFVALMLAETT